MRRVRWAALAALALGCDPEPPPSDAGANVRVDTGRADGSLCNANGAVVTLGTSNDGTLASFRPLAPTGERVHLVPGPQGGQHIWVALRASGVDPVQVRVELKAFRAADDALIGQLRFRFPLSPAPENRALYALPGQPLALDDDAYCAVLPGDVRVTMDFDDGRGHCAHQETVVHVAGIDPLAAPIDRESRVACCTERQRRCYPDGGVAPDARADAALDSAGDP